MLIDVRRISNSILQDTSPFDHLRIKQTHHPQRFGFVFRLDCGAINARHLSGRINFLMELFFDNQQPLIDRSLGIGDDRVEVLTDLAQPLLVEFRIPHMCPDASDFAFGLLDLTTGAQDEAVGQVHGLDKRVDP